MVSNPRYPHSCVISRNTVTNTFPSTEVLATILESECQNQVNSGGGTTKVNGMYDSEYRCYIPLQTTPIYIATDDVIVVNDINRIIKGRIVQHQYGNLGITVWYNQDNTPSEK